MSRINVGRFFELGALRIQYRAEVVCILGQFYRYIKGAVQVLPLGLFGCNGVVNFCVQEFHLS